MVLAKTDIHEHRTRQARRRVLRVLTPYEFLVGRNNIVCDESKANKAEFLRTK